MLLNVIIDFEGRVGLTSPSARHMGLRRYGLRRFAMFFHLIQFVTEKLFNPQEMLPPTAATSQTARMRPDMPFKCGRKGITSVESPRIGRLLWQESGLKDAGLPARLAVDWKWCWIITQPCSLWLATIQHALTQMMSLSVQCRPWKTPAWTTGLNRSTESTSFWSKAH